MNHFDAVKRFYTYEEFMQLMEVLVAEGKTTGPAQSESLIFYTKLNMQRLQRWDKTLHLTEALEMKVKTTKPQIWWVITEAWCGDAAQTLPGIHKMTIASGGNIELRIIMRDENLSIMDEYLTNGARSIPKVIATDKEGNELFTWGPRPAYLQKMMMDWKENPQNKTLEEIEKDIHTWYAKDKGISYQQEFLELLNRL